MSSVYVCVHTHLQRKGSILSLAIFRQRVGTIVETERTQSKFLTLYFLPTILASYGR